MSSLVNCLVQFCKCDVQLFMLQICIFFHVRNKLNLSLQNTWETNTIAIFPSCQACLVWLTVWSSSMLYIVQCGAHLLTVWLISCRVQLTVWSNSANVMFNSSGCNFVLSSMWEINWFFLYKTHEKQIQLLYFQVVKHAWFG